MFNLSLKAEWSNDNFEKKKVKISKNYFVNKHEENVHEPNNNELLKGLKGQMIDG